MSYNLKDYIHDFSSEDTVRAEFKEAVNKYFDCKYSIPVSNGTAAIEVALRSLSLPRGSLVIVPDISFIATATAVANCGLIPVYADVSGDYLGMTLDEVVRKYNSGVKAVIVVHLAGYMNREIFQIRDFCREKGICLLEDCAQALACCAKGKKAGTIGDIGTFSFQSSKIVNAGEGGLIITDNNHFALKCEAISDWGISTGCYKRNLNISSSNFRLSAIQCYFLIKQFEMIDDIVNERLSKCERLFEACREFNVEPYSPKKQKDFFDCPFFFMIKSRKKINTIEPREEYPMRNSSMVREILKDYYPDLVDKYLSSNCENRQNLVSRRILSEIDFINIRQNSEKTDMELFGAYADKIG